MNKKEKYSDEHLEDLVKDLEMMEAPENLKEKIMKDVRIYSVRQRIIPTYLRMAAIALFTAIILLPFTFDPILEFVETSILPSFKPLTEISGNFYFIMIIVFATVLLLLAERLINLFIMIRSNKSFL